MRPLDLFSEPYQPTGSIASAGVRNAVGRPAIDPLTLLVREAAQNSWDARMSDEGPIEFRMDGWTLTDERLRAAAALLNRRPEGLHLDRALAAAGGMRVLVIGDRGTRGLGGPLRADSVDDGDQPRDFVDFLRNVGQPPDRPLGGGTFGYGKSVLYNVSGVSTIAVYTRCPSDAGRQSRFMCAALGPQFQAPSGARIRPFTGRHWWGRMDEGVVDPLLGPDADEAASVLGLRQMEGEETGTSIAVLAPRFEDREPPDAIRYLVSALLWNFWPKMVETDARPLGMSAGASWQGREVPIPDPATHPRLRGFVEALREVDRADGARIGVRIQRPQRHLGWMAFSRFALPLGGGQEDPAAPLGPAIHHVALMRGPRNVVKYMPGEPLPHEAAAYAGVFVADELVDAAFAEAEPPSHDDWLPETLPRGNDKRFVNVGLREIRKELQRHASPPRPATSSGAVRPLGALSGALASLIPWESGSGPAFPALEPAPVDGEVGAGVGRPGTGPDGGAGGTTGGGSRDGSRAGRTSAGRVQVTGRPRVGEEDGRPVVSLPFSVIPGTGDIPTVIALELGVAVQDGDAIEDRPPEGAESPRLLRWETADGRPLAGTGELVLPSGAGGDYSVVVQTHPMLAVGLSLSARRGGS